MRTELIEKLKKVSTGLGRLGQIAEQNTINEAIALLEKPRVSAEDIKAKAEQYAPLMNGSEVEQAGRNGEYYGFIEGYTQAMHDYAGQSDAVEFAKWLRVNFQNDTEEVFERWFDVNYLMHDTKQLWYNTEELYQAFLNREEKQK